MKNIIKICFLFFIFSCTQQNKNQILEKEISVENGDYTLPATLTIPNDTDKFPIVIFVHGSGPNDRDETIFENKTFKNLALGLVNKNIASLRYDKRTFVYRQNSVAQGKEITPDDEVIDDAVAAVELAKTLENVDKSRVFIIGHSLGGHLAPRIAERAELAGIIIMSGNARNLEELIVEQINYLLPHQLPKSYTKEQIAEEAEKHIKKLISQMPESYLEYLHQYNPLEAAAALNIPILVLQGERDYQVTMQDFNLWKDTLRNKTNAEFISYPKLNHIYTEGEGICLPQEYMKKSEIPEYVINDIASWIKKN